MESFLQTEHLFRTRPFRETLEVIARQNIKEEISRLVGK